MKDAEYEFYYNGAYWMLKNNIVQQSAVSDYVNEYPNKIFIGHRGYRIWADGYLEQWGYADLKKQSVINFLLPFTNTKFNFMFGSESSILTFKNIKLLIFPVCLLGFFHIFFLRIHLIFLL